MKKLLFLLLFPVLLHAAGGDTLRYSDRVLSLADADTFFSDIHWHPMKDSIQSILNGRIGNANIAADALIKTTKLDSNDTIIILNLRVKNLIEADSITVSWADIDTIFGPVFIDTILGPVVIDTIAGSVFTDIIRVDDSLFVGGETWNFFTSGGTLLSDGNNPLIRIGDNNVNKFLQLAYISAGDYGKLNVNGFTMITMYPDSVVFPTKVKFDESVDIRDTLFAGVLEIDTVVYDKAVIAVLDANVGDFIDLEGEIITNRVNTKTISSNVLTMTFGHTLLNTEGSISLDSITSLLPTDYSNGTNVTLRLAATSDTILIIDNDGTLNLNGDFEFNQNSDILVLTRYSEGWCEVSRSDNE